uniref:NADH dehydrogenase subunit 4L n=1 Tax=Postharmostomum commutatum TaxID=2336775 RepID=A0A5C1D8E2_9TREM|nr:NADH dehydrogenase subunit 4L [Postharmostomum commutatum]QEL51321.1 NADH dehydrogenase subunit 4L [Postharmostomum commutatum]
MSLVLLYGGLVVLLFSFIMSLSRLLNCLIIVENINVLLLLVCLLSQTDESRIMFLALMVLFTIEVSLGLVMLTRIWSLGSLTDIEGV